MKDCHAPRLPRLVLCLSSLTGLLLLSSCGKEEKGEVDGEPGKKKTGSQAQAPGGTGGTAPARNEKKSGQRDGKSTAPVMTTTASGLQYEVLKEGIGARPGPTDTVTVHYHGTLEDGTVFDSSVERNQPASFPVNGVIKGWIEGLQLMSEGSKYRFVIPSDLAYGSRGAGNKIGPNATLIFEVELIKIN